MFVGKLYGLCELSDELRYIGQTGRPLTRRFAEHLSVHAIKRKSLVARWAARFVRNKEAPKLRVLAVADSSDELDRLEIEWIAAARSSGVRLLNLSCGGESGSRGVKRSPETIAKMKAVPRQPRSAEYRERLGRANRGKTFGAAWRAKFSVRSRGERNGRARLTAQDVADIRMYLACGETTTKLAQHYEVTRSTIGHIKNGRTWK